MPLLDHFHPPLSRTHPLRAFHGRLGLGHGAIAQRRGPAARDTTPCLSSIARGRPRSTSPPCGSSTRRRAIRAADRLYPGRAGSGGRGRVAGGRRCAGGGVRRRPMTPGRRPWWSWSAREIRTDCERVRRSRPSAQATSSAGAAWSSWTPSRHAERTSTPIFCPHSGRGLEPILDGPLRRVVSPGRPGRGRLLTWPEPLEVGQPLPTVPFGSAPTWPCRSTWRPAARGLRRLAHPPGGLMSGGLPQG